MPATSAVIRCPDAIPGIRIASRVGGLRIDVAGPARDAIREVVGRYRDTLQASGRMHA